MHFNRSQVKFGNLLTSRKVLIIHYLTKQFILDVISIFGFALLIFSDENELIGILYVF